MKQNYLYILGSFYPAQKGGPDNTIYWQAKALVAKGKQVTVCCTKDGITDDLKSQYGISWNKITKVNGIQAIYFNYKLKSYLSFSLYKWLFENITKYNFIILTSYFFPISWIAALFAIYHNIPFAIGPRGELSENALKYNRVIKNIFRYSFLRWIYNKAKFVLVTSKQELNSVKKYFNTSMNYELIPNYIDLKPILFSIDPDKRKDILFIGRIHPIKKIEHLIQAYALINAENRKNHKLLIAGSGYEKYINSLQNLVKKLNLTNYIVFLGHVDSPEKEKLYSNAKLFVLPSETENFGNVVLEALSCSTPVIASLNTPWNDVEKYQCGLWVGNKPKSLAKAILFFLNLDNKLYATYTQNARKYVENEFSIQNNINKLVHILGKYS